MGRVSWQAPRVVQGEGDNAAFGVALAQRATRGILHHQEGHAVLHVVIQDAHNRGVLKLGNRLGFLMEVLGRYVTASDK